MTRKQPTKIEQLTDENGKLPDEVYERMFDPMFDLQERWGLTMNEAEEFLEEVGYFHWERQYIDSDSE
jgi:hypothetical protein